MTNEQQRIAIAKACGWTVGKDGNWKDPNGKYGINGCPLNYPQDLNAMHEAEKVLKTRPLWDKYIFTLRYNCNARSDAVPLNTLIGHYEDRDIVCATSQQRAEAFLRTLNLWKD